MKSTDKESKAWMENMTNSIRALTDIELRQFVPGEMLLLVMMFQITTFMLKT